MIDLNEKLKRQCLSGLEALEFLRRLRGTSAENLPETIDPQVKLSFGRGYRVVGPSATLEELLAAPTVVDETAYVRVPVSRREQPALFCAKEEADCFSLCWNDIIKGEKIQREGSRLYDLEEETSTVEFLSSEGVDPIVVYRKRQEPIIEYELRKIEIEIEPLQIPKFSLPAVEPKIEREVEPQPIDVSEVEDELTDGSVKQSTVLESTVYADQNSSHASGNSIQATLEPIAIPPAVKPPKRPVGRPPVWSSEAERKAHERQIKREQREMEAAEERRNRDTVSLTETENEVAVTMGIKKPAKPTTKREVPSVLDAYPLIRKVRGGKTSGISKNLLVKRVLEQNELCIYCDRRFGSLVLIDGNIVSLEAQPDHFQPVADRRNDNPSNIHAADQICNERIKGSRKFASLEEARRVIQAAWVERGWTDAPSLEAVCPAHIKRVLDFMQSSMPSTELLAAASGVAKFAPLFCSSK